MDQSARLQGRRQADVERGSIVGEGVDSVGEGHGLLLRGPGALTVDGVDEQGGVGVQDQSVDPRLDRDQVQDQPAAHLLHCEVDPQVQVKVPQLEAPEVGGRGHVHQGAAWGPGARRGPAGVPCTAAPQGREGFPAAAQRGGGLLELRHHELQLGLNPRPGLTTFKTRFTFHTSG